MLRSFGLTFCAVLLVSLLGILLACLLAPQLLLPGMGGFHLHVIPTPFNAFITDTPAYELLLLAPWPALSCALWAAMHFRIRSLREVKMQKIKLRAIENRANNNVLFCSDRFVKRQP